MARRPKCDEPSALRHELELLVAEFDRELQSGNLRAKVLALIPVFHKLRDLGSSLVPVDRDGRKAARARILEYLRRYPHAVIQGDELMVVSGIQEYARRIRELRVQFGWKILSGVTARDMVAEQEEEGTEAEWPELAGMTPSDYILVDEEPDRDAAYRWNLANELRRQSGGVRPKILEYLRKNVGLPVTGEELRYIAKDKKEWARRVRELRTEFGWPITTKVNGRPDLPIGTYVLEADRQSPEHDRHIPDTVRGEVLRRDSYTCQQCQWTHDLWNPSDPRHLELHHIHPHVEGGDNEPENLATLCTVCHDAVHARKSAEA